MEAVRHDTYARADTSHCFHIHEHEVEERLWEMGVICLIGLNDSNTVIGGWGRCTFR